MVGYNKQRLSSLHKIKLLELSMDLVSLETKKESYSQTFMSGVKERQ